MTSTGFGPAVPFQLPVINPHDVLNDVYAMNAEQHARQNPHDQYAQALHAHWSNAMTQIRMMRAAAAGQPVPPGPHQGAPPQAPPMQQQFQPVPSFLPGVTAQTLPPDQAAVSGAPIHHGSSERGSLRTPQDSQYHTPTGTRASTPVAVRVGRDRDRRRAEGERPGVSP